MLGRKQPWNLQIKLDDGQWVSVGCYREGPLADGSAQQWTVSGRRLKSDNGYYLDCDEGWPAGRECECDTADDSEAYHAMPLDDEEFDLLMMKHPEAVEELGNELDDGLKDHEIWIFPNSGHEICLSAHNEGDKITATDAKIGNRPGGDHAESKHDETCSRWCFGDCPTT